MEVSTLLFLFQGPVAAVPPSSAQTAPNPAGLLDPTVSSTTPSSVSGPNGASIDVAALAAVANHNAASMIANAIGEKFANQFCFSVQIGKALIKELFEKKTRCDWNLSLFPRLFSTFITSNFSLFLLFLRFLEEN